MDKDQSDKNHATGLITVSFHRVTMDKDQSDKNHATGLITLSFHRIAMDKTKVTLLVLLALTLLSSALARPHARSASGQLANIATELTDTLNESECRSLP